jgi:hypothetical protein
MCGVSCFTSTRTKALKGIEIIQQRCITQAPHNCNNVARTRTGGTARQHRQLLDLQQCFGWFFFFPGRQQCWLSRGDIHDLVSSLLSQPRTSPSAGPTQQSTFKCINIRGSYRLHRVVANMGRRSGSVGTSELFRDAETQREISVEESGSLTWGSV